ncbi:DUF3649 domain-containing protein [Pigmentiphaga aceris]|uniref:DUF3649 domain-containing protein n=1 Tax=Pigmentiphaga aceris TaxID=1940612 RepID=A0A5C0B3E3_9BURK|nr:DUF3649 domain-containing protein [Pigmentiphaga aceris]
MLRYRLSVLSRVVAASVGAYAVTSLISAAFALALPWVTGASRADAVMLATMLSFAVYTMVALWVFCVRTALRAWIGLGCVAVAAGLVLLGARVLG